MARTRRLLAEGDNERKRGRRRPSWATHEALVFLASLAEPQPADAVGAWVWRGKVRGRVTSSGGGGDYAAQMLLGRMKAAGLVRRSADHTEGSTRWEITDAGRARLVP